MKNAPKRTSHIVNLITLMKDYAGDKTIDNAEKAARIEQCAINAIRAIIANRDHWIEQANRRDYL